MSQVTLFISAVTSEFAEDPVRSPDRVRGPGDYRTFLRDKLTGPDVCVKVQEDFIAGGVLTLDKLVIYIKQCDAVIHLVGDMTGAPASALATEAIYASEPSIAQKLPFVPTPDAALATSLAYTQWEAYLAVHFGKRLVICTAEMHAPRAAGFASDDAQREHQARHVERLKELKRYPEIRFASREELAIEVLRMLRTVLPESQSKSLPAPPCRLPYTPLGELFVGRDDLLESIRSRAEHAQESGRWPRQVVHGLGGTGKTRLAVEYAWRFRDRYGAVLLINGESQRAIDRDLASLTGVFRLQCDPTTPEPQRTQMALEWLRDHPGWLLVVDNVDTEEARQAVISRLPDWVNGHVLITARVADWPREIEVLGLHVLAPADAARFLLEATEGHRMTAPDDAAQAHALANDELGALCLALEQAAAYVSKLQISLADYRRRWATNVKDVRRRADRAVMRYHEEKEVSLSVATTWQTTVDQLSPVSRALLEMLSWLAPDALPDTLMEHQSMAAALTALTGNEDDDIEYALAELRGYSLLSARQSEPPASAGQLHRLVQLVTHDSLSAEERQRTLSATMRALADYSDQELSALPVAVLPQFLPHLSTVIVHADALGLTQDLARLLRARGSILYNGVRLGDAEASYRRALHVDEAELGVEHPTVGSDLHELAEVLVTSDRFAEAEPLHRRALAICEAHYDASDPKIAAVLHSLSVLVQLDNRPEEAEVLIRRAMAINERHHGAEHRSVAGNLSDLARIRWYDGRLEEAEGLMRRALAIKEKVLGSSALGISSDLSNLAAVLKERNAMTEAEALFRRALAIETDALGVDHPSVAVILNNLGQLLASTNRPQEAEIALREAAAIDERRLGANHRNLSRDLNNLASILMGAGRLDESESLLRRALAIGERTAGPNHPEVAATRINLADVLSVTGRLDEAEQLASSALEILERTFGVDSPKTTRALTTLGTILRDLGRAGDAERQLRRALAHRDAARDGSDVATASLLVNLAHLLRATDQSDEAEAMLRRAIPIYEQQSVEDDLSLAASLGTLGQLLGRTNRAAEGEEMLRRSLAIYEKARGLEDASVANALALLAELLDTNGRAAESVPMLARAVSIYERCGDAHRADLAMAAGALGRVLRDSGRMAEAEPLLLRALALDAQVYPADHEMIALDLLRLGKLRRMANRLDESREVLMRAKAIYERMGDSDRSKLSWATEELERVNEQERQMREAGPRLPDARDATPATQG